MKRYDFLKTALFVALGKGVEAAETILTAVEKVSTQEKMKQRPPGALEERAFVRVCTGCDGCMIACPYNIIFIEDLETRLPLIYSKESPCMQCPDTPCISACPTGALSALPS